jgi:hypothetical protein
VNFFAHAVLAGRIRAEPDFVFGAMLPDLSRMAGGRIERGGSRGVQDGSDIHHAMDSVFHDLPEFLRLCREGTALLREAGLRRGIALGAAHVSIELTLDGWLAEHGGVPDVYREALAVGRHLSHSVSWRGVGSGGRLAEVCWRVNEAPLPEAYAEADFVAARTARALAGRPRLALDAREEAALGDAIRAQQVSVRAAAPGLVAAVAQSL